jgi:hypothetical protein
VRHAHTGGHEVELSGADQLLGTEAVSVQHLALDEPADGLQPDVGVRTDVEAVVLGDRGGTEVVGEAPRADRAPRASPTVVVTSGAGYALRLPPAHLDAARFAGAVTAVHRRLGPSSSVTAPLGADPVTLAAAVDELDAALDDANIGRFVDALKDFLDRSQFLIITHNQHTIAGSDLVYGVSQQEKGISRIISMRLTDIGVKPVPEDKA